MDTRKRPVASSTSDTSRDLDATFAEILYLGAPELADQVDTLRLFDDFGEE